MNTINGLPAHPLLVHLAVVAIPLAAIIAVLAACWPAARRWLGPATPLVALVAVVVTPLTTSAGEALEKRTRPNPALETHANLGDQMIYWVAPLFVLATLMWALHTPLLRRYSATVPAGASRLASMVLGVLTVIVSVGAIVWVYRIGDSGAQSVWSH